MLMFLLAFPAQATRLRSYGKRCMSAVGLNPAKLKARTSAWRYGCGSQEPHAVTARCESKSLETSDMNNLVYLIGLIVVIGFIVSLIAW
jgi:hypothetical protein